MSDPGKLRIWCDTDLSPKAMSLLEAGLDGHQLVLSGSRGNNLSAQGKSPELEGAHVAFGQPDPGQVIESSTLRYVQITSAGYTRYDTAAFAQKVNSGLAFCNSSSVYDEPCAQHLVAFMLAQARQIPAAVVEQANQRAWIFDRLRPATRILKGEKVLILGYGAIAKRLIEMLAPFNLDIVALRRQPKGTELAPTSPISELSSFLPSADHVINILPANDSTRALIDGARFAEMKRGAIFYNIGRGTTVDQSALIAALKSGHVSAALLDVSDPEPLPADHPLWTAPNCVITPHIAGGFKDEDLALVSHFLANLARFETAQPMQDSVFS